MFIYITSTLIQQMTVNWTKFNPYWAGRAPAERCKMTVHIYFDFIFSLIVQQKHLAGSANFSSNFWLLVLTSFCFSLTASSFLLAFAWFNLAISIMTHTTFATCEPWNLKTGHPATYLHLLKAELSSVIRVSSIASCSFFSNLSSVSLNDLVSFPLSYLFSFQFLSRLLSLLLGFFFTQLLITMIYVSRLHSS